MRNYCKLKAEEMKEKQNRALLEAKEKLKLENPIYQELRRIEITDVDLETG